MPAHLAQPSTCGQRANVLVLSHLGRRVLRGTAATPKPGVQHELNNSGVRWQDLYATKWCVLIPIFSWQISNKYRWCIKNVELSWIWMVQLCKVQIDGQDCFIGGTMCQNCFHNVCMYWALLFMSKDSEVLQVAIVEYKSIQSVWDRCSNHNDGSDQMHCSANPDLWLLKTK